MTTVFGPREWLLRTSRGQGRDSRLSLKSTQVCPLHYLQSISFLPTLAFLSVVQKVLFTPSFAGPQHSDQEYHHFSCSCEVCSNAIHALGNNLSTMSILHLFLHDLICEKLQVNTGNCAQCSAATQQHTNRTSVHPQMFTSCFSSLPALWNTPTTWSDTIFFLISDLPTYFQHFPVTHRLKLFQHPFPKPKWRSSSRKVYL